MKMFDLTGKVAVVTGGNGGIGLAMARGMAEAGASIIVAGRNAEKLGRGLGTQCPWGESGRSRSRRNEQIRLCPADGFR